jgi:hypothetical protein
MFELTNSQRDNSGLGVRLALVLGCFLFLGAPSLLRAQLTTTSCGGNGDGVCSVATPEFWANDSGSCDRGLKASNGVVRGVVGDGVCTNDSRSTQAYSGSWVQWAMNQQRYSISKDVPYNYNVTLGTHNSYSNYADGDNNPFGTNQNYSITDQLNLGARNLRLDPVEYFGEVRLCHTSSLPIGSLTISGPDVCATEAVAEYANLALLMSPFLEAINLLPIPVPELIDGLFLYELISSNEQTVNINNRLYVSAIREIADWLTAHPSEFITLGLNVDSSVSDNSNIAAPIATYLGSKVFTGDEYKSQWPSINTLVNTTHKQIAVLTCEPSSPPKGCYPYSYQGTNWTIDENTKTQYPDEQHGTYPGVPDMNFTTCTWNSGVGVKTATNESVRTSEGRTGSDFLGSGSYTGILEAKDVALATQCGFNGIDLDFFMALGNAYGPFAESGPDLRREATIWSWQQDDYGQGGVAAMDVSSGRWLSTPTFQTGVNYPYACFDTSLLGYPKHWSVTTTRGDYYSGVPACLGLGASFVFAYPETAPDNAAIKDAAIKAGLLNGDRVYLNYSVGIISPSATSPITAVAYMDQGGIAPDPVPIATDGQRDLFFYPNLNSDRNNAFFLLNLGNMGSPANPIPYAAGPQTLLWQPDPNVVQTLPQAGSGYGASFVVDLYQSNGSGGFNSFPYPKGVYPTNGAISLHVLYPTTTTMCAVDPSANSQTLCGPTPPITTHTNFTLVAQVYQDCAPPPGQNTVKVTGTVTFTDTVYARGGKVTTTILGWAPINNSPDEGGPLGQGQLPVATCPGPAGNPNNTVCASVGLGPGQHNLAAHYNRDSSFNSSASDVYILTVAGYTNLTSLVFNFALPNASPQTQTLQYTGNGVVTGITLPSGLGLQASGVNPFVITAAPPHFPGAYNGMISVNLTGFAGNVLIPVQINATGPMSEAKPLVSLSSTDQAVPALQQIEINYLGGTLTATSPNAPWLTLTTTPNQNQAFGEVSVTASATGLAAGTYTGTILVSQPGNPKALSIPVTLTETLSGTIPSITIDTSPSHLQVICDSVTHTAPFTLLDKNGGVHTCQAVTTVQYPAAGTRALFQGWDDGYNGLVRSITASTAGQNFKIDYRLQYEVSISTDPACSGTVLPLQDWYNPGTTANPVATPNQGFSLVGYTGDINCPQATCSVFVGRPLTAVAHFACSGSSCQPTLVVSPTSVIFKNRKNQEVNVTASDSSAIEFNVVSQAPSWLTVHTTRNTTPATLTLALNPLGLHAGNNSTAVVLQPSNGTAEVQFSVNVPLVAAKITSSPSGLQIAVDNTPVKTPASFLWISGTQHSLDAPSTISSPSEKLTFKDWSDQGAATHVVTAPKPGRVTYEATYSPSYLLTLTNPASGGTVSASPASSDGFYAFNAPVTITAQPAAGYTFTGFTGDLIVANNPQTVTMSQPRTVGAIFALAPVAVTVQSQPPNTVIYVDNVAYLTPHFFTWNPGDQHSVDATKTNPPNGVRLIFTGWSDGGSAVHQVTVPAGNETLTATFTTSYLLTLSTSGSGTVSTSPASPTNDGYYPASTNVTLTAVPAAGNYLVGFGGALAGTTNPQSLTMSAPLTVLASFAALP